MRRYLDMLFGGAQESELCELRAKRPGEGMRREFVPARDWLAIEQAALRLAEDGDCYVGICPRKRTEPQTGGRDAVEWAHVLWADCDTDESVKALANFDPLPAVVVRSGSGGVHAYWPIPPTPVDVAVAANRRVAERIGADVKATDAARILRPPGTRNFKHTPPKAVEMSRCEAELFTVEAVAGAAPPVELPKRRAPKRATSDLDRIAPTEYMAVLCGVERNREGMVRCPLPDHGDRTPSCRVYDDPEQGWHCFGCNRGGSIYDLAAGLWGLRTRGDDFRELWRRLRDEFRVAA